MAGVASQLPFWIGSTLWILQQIRQPIEVNMVADLAMSVLFVFLAHRTGKAFYAFLSLLFVCAACISIWAVFFGTPSLYMMAHEFIHYACLIVILGRTRVSRYSGDIGRRLRALASG
ncbi:hypothetical protein [Ruegeria sp. HKCCD6109]|uniref:hypothetical protein n=1 Tax=Ruegeria sp. HKCCD6109 TaxID=2683017 RepID=UPI0014920812|nr:hypothetical protein [Ruegeria sp. HKCCD6109]